MPPDNAKPGRAFTSYAAQRYTWDDQKRLAQLAGRAAARGALVVVTNAWAPEVCDLYQAEGFRLAPAVVRYNIGATGARRGNRVELVAVSATCPPLTIV
jgi:DNA adenine methylase